MMMEIPPGKCCGRSGRAGCRFFAQDMENDPKCQLFDEFPDHDLMGTVIHDWDNDKQDYIRCPACFAALPDGGTITVEPKHKLDMWGGYLTLRLDKEDT